MRPKHEIEQGKALHEQGLNDCQIARAVGTGRHNVRYWRTHGWQVGGYRGSGGQAIHDCPRCDDRPLDERSYAYLLGLYLGDGWISKSAGKEVYRLRIALDEKYPIIIGLAAESITAVRAAGRGLRGVRTQGWMYRGVRLLEALAVRLSAAGTRSQAPQKDRL